MAIKENSKTSNSSNLQQINTNKNAATLVIPASTASSSSLPSTSTPSNTFIIPSSPAPTTSSSSGGRQHSKTNKQNFYQFDQDFVQNSSDRIQQSKCNYLGGGNIGNNGTGGSSGSSCGNGKNSFLNISGLNSLSPNISGYKRMSNILNNTRMTTSVTSDCGPSSEQATDGNDDIHHAGSGAFIKPSLSMTSLPPPANESHQENKEIIKAKLRLERPYNSLKKKRNSERETSWRNSWGSGHSQSSCSLHSNATGIIGKDEFWAALQTNYNYIMDTNLLDTCKEARYEIEGLTTPTINTIDCCGKMLQSPRIEAISEDPRELRKWLRDMENQISKAPSLHEATQLSIDELQRRLNDHSVLYCEIVSHARVVGACIKAAKEKSAKLTTTTTTTSISTPTTSEEINTSLTITDNSSSADNSLNSFTSAEEKSSIKANKIISGAENNKIESAEKTAENNCVNGATTCEKTDISGELKRLENVKSLERRYHLLYLKAIEVQCLFEGLLKKKTSENISIEDYLSNGETETDDEPVSKLARLSDSECNLTRNYLTSFGNTLDENLYCDHQPSTSDYNIKSEEDFDDGEENITPRLIINEVDEVDCSLDFIREWQNYSFNSSLNTASEPTTTVSGGVQKNLKYSKFIDPNTEFDADFEDSDFENNLSASYLRKRQKRVNLSAGCIIKKRHPVALKRRHSHSPFNRQLTVYRNDFFPEVKYFENNSNKQKDNFTELKINEYKLNKEDNKMDANGNCNGSVGSGGGGGASPLLQQNPVVVQNPNVYDCNRISPQNDKKLLLNKNSPQNLNRSPNSITIGINPGNGQNNKNKIGGNTVPKVVNCSDENLLDICNGNSSSCGGSSIVNGPQRVSTPISPSPKQTSGQNGSVTRRHKNGDASKFNRSNRKSKNCAIFYFKHLDTDTETQFGLSSQGEHELINGEPTSSGDDCDEPMENDFDDDDECEDEGWLYTNNKNGNNESMHIPSVNGNSYEIKNDNQHLHQYQQLHADDSDKENKLISVSNESRNRENHRDSNGNIQEHRPSPIRSTISQSTNQNMTKHEIQYHKFSPSPARTISTTTVTTFATANTAELIIIENSDNEYQPPQSIQNNNSTDSDKKDGDLKKTSSKISINKSETTVTTLTASTMSTSSSTEMTQFIQKEESLSTNTNHDSIKQLVIDAENLVREDCMRTPTKKSIQKIFKTPRNQKVIKTSKSTVKKRDLTMPGTPNIQKVQEWLEHQPMSPKKEQRSNFIQSTDCEASGENTESDTGAAHESDTSEGLTDSVATCMQTGGSTSQCTSTEIIGGSAEPIIPFQIGSNQSLNGKVIRRQIQNRRNSDRPWSVSCISQLTATNANQNNVINTSKPDDVQAGLATHSISESALHVLSSPSRNVMNNSKNSPHTTPVKNSDSKNSLKRKKIRRRKPSSSTKKSDSGSEGLQAYDLPKLTESLLKTETISSEQMTIIKDLSDALSLIQLPKAAAASTPNSITNGTKQNQESDDDLQHLPKPNFKIGPYTSAHISTNEVKLGSLAALANYMNEDGDYNTGTDEHNSSFSEQAWDNYQEKYNSENYSEGFDSDAARKLLEFGDDYRAFLDSQSDCCSSLSAANNLDSLSPPRMDSLTNNQPPETKLTQESISSTVDHARRRRALELEYERRRRNLEMKRKASQDNIIGGVAINNLNSPISPTVSCSTTGSPQGNPITPKNNEINRNTYPRNAAIEAASRRLDFDAMSSTAAAPIVAISNHKTSESDSSSRRRRTKLIDDGGSCLRRRSRQNLEKPFKSTPYSSESSNSSDSEDEKEFNNLVEQSRNRLENTEALKIRSHLLRPEDYTEIIATCRDNINCLNTVLNGPPGTVLSTGQQNQLRDLLSSWEAFLAWSENAGAARKMQEEMHILKNTLNRLGLKELNDLDSESSIQLLIEELKNEKSNLQAYRTNMLRLNASVHSWLTRQEMKVQKELKALKESNDLKMQQQKEGTNEAQNNENQVDKTDEFVEMMNTETRIQNILQSENEFHKHLKDEVSEMYKAWDEADARVNTKLETLQSSLNTWRQLENGLSEFHQVLSKDRGTLHGLEGALENGRSAGELAQNVKLVAKLLSERCDTAKQQIVQVAQEQHIDPHQLIHITRFAASNGSLSDSGISDGGTTSDGGLSERERRLGVLRRLAKQLENALAPGSEALKSISARMEAAEAELKKLQTTCREIIVRTAVQQQNKATMATQQQQQQLENDVTSKKIGSGVEEISPSKTTSNKKRKPRKSPKNGNLLNGSGDSDSGNTELSDDKDDIKKSERRLKINNSTRKSIHVGSGGPGDPDDPKSGSWDPCDSGDESTNNKKSWSWRVARVALPMQLALLTLFCAACLMQPHCCDSLNNFSMSFTPQLRYVRGPPPI